MLSQMMSRISESGTMRMAAEAINLRSQGYEIINLGVGEPDFNTSDFIKNAAKDALDKNLTHYTLNRGIKELRDVICNWLQAEFNVEYSSDEIIISNGAKQAIFNTILALVSPGDEVIIPTPCWPTYIELIKAVGAIPVLLKTGLENNFKISPEQLKSALSEKTKALVFSNPSNPTGMTYDGAELKGLVDVLKDTNVFILSDEIYSKLIYDNCPFDSVGIYREVLKDRIILFQGVSKAFAMTGWRLGFAAGPREVIKACDIIQGHATSSVSSISQYAAVAAFSGPQNDVIKMRTQFDERRKFVMQYLKKIPGMKFIKPDGAFYFFPKIDAFYGISPDGTEIKNSTDLALYILRNAQVSVVPGQGFAAEHYLRISYANSLSQLEKGLKAIKRTLDQIKRK